MEVLHRAAPGKGDGLDFVLSDESLGRDGMVIRTKGWDTRDFRNNPIALFSHDPRFPIGRWDNLRTEGDRLIGTLKLAARGTSQRIDELISLVEQGILRAVSVGFRVHDRDGATVTRAELTEASLVSVPALPSALAMARSLDVSDETLRLAFGEQAARGQVERTGEHAAIHSPRKTPKMEKRTLSERIEDAQDELTRSRDTLTELNSQEPLDLDAIEEMHGRVETQERALAALKRSETLLAARSEPAAGQRATVPAQAARRPFGVAGKDTKPGEALIRAAAVHVVSFATGKEPEHILERMYGDDEGTGVLIRAAVAGATTTTSGWAAELVNTQMDGFIETLRQDSVYPALSAAAGGRLAFGPNSGAIKIPSRASTPSIGGSFVGEGAPIPVRRLGLSSITLTPKKMGVISVFSREIARYSTPAIEALIRQEIVADTAITLDSLLLDATAASSVRPAGLLNGVTAVTETAGGTYAAILADFRALRAPFDTANAGNGLMVLMNPAQMEALNLTPGADGTLGWANAVIDRYRIVTSNAIPAGTVIMLRAADFVTATGDTPEFELSNEATIHMEDTTPLQIGTTGTPTTVAAPVASMFQTAQIAIRMLLDVSWAMRRTGMVQFVEDVTW